jgi:hypothetical protein
VPLGLKKLVMFCPITYILNVMKIERKVIFGHWFLGIATSRTVFDD